MRIYETMFIIDPNLEDAERDELANRVKNWIEEKINGKVRDFDRWGIRQLAFRVQKFTQGDYTVVIFEAEPESVRSLEEMYRITPRIFRWMVFRREDLEKAGKKATNKESAEETSEKENVEEEPEKENIAEASVSQEGTGTEGGED